MSPLGAAVLAGAEGTGARIAWVVVYVLCWCCVVFPFALWYAGVRTPRAERAARKGATAPAGDASEREEHHDPVRATG
jgi:hypothetical protein